MKLHSLAEAEAALRPFIPSVAQVTGRDITLERMWPMMEILGNPERKLKIVHLAGTSGKTSTAYYLAALLQAAGKKIGLHVSPHIDKVTERFQIAGAPISDELFCQELGAFLDIIHAHGLHPTYFELHIAFAYWLFDRQHVDYAVMETGMGGLHDGTNVAQNPDKICVITDIGLDHTKFLGHTIPEIAFQKAGIIHEGNTVLMYEQSAEVMDVVKAQCAKVNATLQTTTEARERTEHADSLLDDLPQYQQRNWLLANFTFAFIVKRDNLRRPKLAALQKTERLQVPARMDLRQLDGKTLVMDGAHNEQKMQALVKSFKVKFPSQKAAVLLSLKKDKDYKTIVDVLLPIAGEVIATTFKTSQDLPVISMKPEILADYCRQRGLAKVQAIADHHQAYEALRKSKERILLITGSFYLLYQIRNEEHLV